MNAPSLAIQQIVPDYVPDVTAAAFHASPAMYRFLRGPIGSGKSVACVNEIKALMVEQRPGPDGVRRTKFGAIRNTYPELKSTTIKTWQQWFPQEICPIVYESPIVGRIKLRNGLPDGTWDGTYIESEILFVSMDKPDDVKKLKSLDLTSLWLNEVSELPKAALDDGFGRCARFPPKFLGGPTRPCLIADTNSPDDDHWLYHLECELQPDGYAFFVQPPALLRFGDGPKAKYFPNPAATYARFQSKGFGYWMDLIPGRNQSWIDVYVMGKYGSTIDGRPVYEAFNEHVHCAKEDIPVMRGMPLYIGIDGGLTPAAVFGQLTPRGRLNVIDELWSPRAGMKQFVNEMLMPHIKANYDGMARVVTYDPALETPDAGDIMSSPSNVLATAGLTGEPAPTNVFATRKGAVDEFLLRMIDGGPGFLLSPKCKLLRKGFNGGYHYRRLQIAGHERYRDEPEKNKWSHPHDGLQYLALSIVEGRSASTTLLGQRFYERPVERVQHARSYG